METNIVELEENDGITNLKLNGQKIKRIKSYNLKKVDLEDLELTLTIFVDSLIQKNQL